MGAHAAVAARSVGRQDGTITKNRHYAILSYSGRASGNLHGANLMRGLAKADPEAEFRFWGGDMMAEAGGAADLVKHYRETSFSVSPTCWPIWGHRPTDARVSRGRFAFRARRVDLIDYPGFNVKMASSPTVTALRCSTTSRRRCGRGRSGA